MYINWDESFWIIQIMSKETTITQKPNDKVLLFYFCNFQIDIIFEYKWSGQWSVNEFEFTLCVMHRAINW